MRPLRKQFIWRGRSASLRLVQRLQTMQVLQVQFLRHLLAFPERFQ